MGSRIAALALSESRFDIVGAIELPGRPIIGRNLGQVIHSETAKSNSVKVTDDVAAALQAGDVLIEFTRPEPTLDHVALARELKKPVVIGTTGFTDDQHRQIVEAAKEIPIVLSPNMSVGVNLLFELVRTASERLGLAYDVEVIEAHHRAKEDRPSGTAKRLAEVAAEGRRQPAERIPIHSIRAGDIVGDHTVVFAGPSERVELTHRAHSRDAFAVGALRAARFLHGIRRAGLYDMRDVLNSG